MYDMTYDCLQQFTLSSDWNQKEKTQQSFVVQDVVWGLRKEFIEHETSGGFNRHFMSPIRSCVLPQSTDNRPRDL